MDGPPDAVKEASRKARRACNHIQNAVSEAITLVARWGLLDHNPHRLISRHPLPTGAHRPDDPTKVFASMPACQTHVTRTNAVQFQGVGGAHRCNSSRFKSMAHLVRAPSKPQSYCSYPGIVQKVVGHSC